MFNFRRFKAYQNLMGGAKRTRKRSKNMRNMKTTFISKKSVIKVVILAVALTVACSTLTGFSRKSAAALIEKDKRYGAPLTMTIDIGRRLTNAAAGISQMTADETAEQAIPRVRADFMQRHPQLFVAEQLGFIKLQFTGGELGERPMGAPRFDNRLGYWTFKPTAEITDAGRKLWTDLNLEIDEKNLPLAQRSEPEITGLKDENQSMKSSDFTFRWEPTKLGKAFDQQSDEFKQMPPDLQQALGKVQQNIFGGGTNNIADFKNARTGRAFFQRFDDGWRISNLAFF